MDSTLLGRLLYWTGEWPHWMSGIPSGNNLRSRLPGMLVKNVCILRWGVLRSSGDNPTSLRLTRYNSAQGEHCWLAGDIVPCRAYGRPTLLGENYWTLSYSRGVKVSWLRSSAELTLVPWWTEPLDCLDNSLLPLFLMLPVEVLWRLPIDKSSSGRRDDKT